MPSTKILSEQFINSYKEKSPKWGFNGLGYIVYKRTYARLKPNGQTEEWYETVARCVNGAQEIGADYSKEEAEKLYDHIFNLRCSFSGRSLWQLGTPLVRDHYVDSLLNCWVTKVSTIDDLYFIFTESMLGGGVGCVVTKEYTQELPRVKAGVNCVLKNTKDADYIVPDSKEGWGELWKKLLEAYLITGKSFSYSMICIRNQGEPLKTFGGVAPGPKPLIDGAEELCKILEHRHGKKLRTQDVCDIICCGGQVVKSGGIRRTALILQGDVDDTAFLMMKRWDLGNIPNYRSNSNNSLICNKFDHISEKYWENGWNGNGECYGLLNIKNSRKVGRIGESKIDGFDLIDNSIIGLNPCQRASARILTPTGIKTLGEVGVGDLIWSKEGWTSIINKWSTGVNKVFKYTTTGGSFEGTEAHRVISNGQKIEARDAESIDLLSGPSPLVNWFDLQSVMDGLVFGDGSVHKASNNLVHLYIGQKDSSYFDSEIKTFILKHRPGIKDTAYEIQTSITSNELPLTFSRTIPDRFIFGKTDVVKGFLRGLYSANGSICGNRVTLKATSKKVIEDVQIMLSSIGIRSYITTNKATEIEFENGTYLCKQSYDLNISSDRQKFRSLIGFLQPYKNEKLYNLIKEIKSSISKETYDIINSEFISEEETFDITVSNGSHTYWTSGVNVSNCSEATLADKESCNLAEIFLNNLDSKEQMLECSVLLYKTQKAIAARNYLFDETNKTVHKHMRLGLGVTGVCQKLDVLDEWCDYTYRNLRKFDKDYSKQKGWPQSIRLTVVKPSGTLSLLGGATPGGHPGYSKHHIRRVRFSSSDPLVEKLRKAGHNIEPEQKFDGSLDRDIAVVSFYCELDNKTIVSKDIGAIKQLEIVKRLQTVWADQAVSVTIYFKPEEIPEIKEWLKLNYDSSIKSVSFLLHSNHNFAQAPLEEIEEEKYQKLIKNLKPIEFISDNGIHEIDNMECQNGTCPIR